MDSPIWTYFFYQVVYQLPLVIASVVGIVLSLVFISRSRTASFIALAAAIVLLIASFAVPAAQGYVFRARMYQLWSPAAYTRLMTIIALLGTSARALAIIALFVAVFVGRKRVAAPTT